ncbi:MAG: hypothetical protein ACP5PS_03195 [Bacteroidales bacterium]
MRGYIMLLLGLNMGFATWTLQAQVIQRSVISCTGSSMGKNGV